MPTGAITGYIDVAQLVLYAFWIFFAGLIIYLRREDKREGYPLESDRSERAPRVSVVGFPKPPPPKFFKLPHGEGTRQAPRDESPMREIPGTIMQDPWNGSPLIPSGDPMRDGVGPASYAQRDDVPDLNLEGHPQVVPMRIATDFSVEASDPDPRGMDVVGADGQIAGKVKDIWVDRSEPRILYFEVELTGSENSQSASPEENASETDAATQEGAQPAKASTNPLLPIGYASVRFRQGQIRVASIMAHHFEHVPRTRSADQVTRLEEDRITAYYSGGQLYADPARQEPIV